MNEQSQNKEINNSSIPLPQIYYHLICLYKNSLRNTAFRKKNSIDDLFTYTLQCTFNNFGQKCQLFTANTFFFTRHCNTSFTWAPRRVWPAILVSFIWNWTFFFSFFFCGTLWLFFARRILRLKLIRRNLRHVYNKHSRDQVNRLQRATTIRHQPTVHCALFKMAAAGISKWLKGCSLKIEKKISSLGKAFFLYRVY